MKRVFAVLSLCLGFSVAFGLDGTLHIESKVAHPQTGAKTTINLGTYTFDVFKDRRELVREIYGICQNPPEKMKTFIANRTNLGDNGIDIYFRAKNVPGFKYVEVLSCELKQGKLDAIGEFNGAGIEEIDRVVDYIVADSYYGGDGKFSRAFALFIDSARAEAKAKDINVTTPNKSIAIKFGTREINPETGAESISTYPDFDYEFNVYDDRRELWKATFNACTKLRGNILNEIKNGNPNPTMSVWYEHPQGGLAELESLKCEFDNNGMYLVKVVNGVYSVGIVVEKLSKKEIEKLVDEKKEWVGDKRHGFFNRDFMTLIDMANAGTKQTKSNPKTKK